jgi:hypothetical protein
LAGLVVAILVLICLRRRQLQQRALPPLVEEDHVKPYGMGTDDGRSSTGGAQVSQMGYTYLKAPIPSISIHTGTPPQSGMLGSGGGVGLVSAISPKTPMSGKRALIQGVEQSPVPRSRDATSATSATSPQDTLTRGSVPSVTDVSAARPGPRALPALPAPSAPNAPSTPSALPVQAEDEFEERFQARLMQFLQTNMDQPNVDVDGGSEAALPRYPGT